MESAVFFNPGDAIANDYDYAAARRSAQIFKAKHVVEEGLVVAQGADGQFSVFYEAAQKPQAGVPYTILARL